MVVSTYLDNPEVSVHIMIPMSCDSKFVNRKVSKLFSFSICPDVSRIYWSNLIRIRKLRYVYVFCPHERYRVRKDNRLDQ